MLNHRVLPYGEQALLIEFDSSQEAAAGGQALAAARTEVVTEIVPGMKTQTVRFNRKRANASEINSWINRVLSAADSNQTLHTTEVVEIPVQYNGADLHAVATELGLSPAELIAEHKSCEWRVAFSGFTPGFGYLISPQWQLQIPRHSTPRTEVPRGAVALAADFCGIYPRTSPGGWQLIGHTDVELWNLEKSPPALLTPGTRVRFVESNWTPTASAT